MGNHNPLKNLKDIIGGSERLLAFTGAGLSADSGIATYRGAGGIWSRYDPAKYASISYFREDPTYYWRFFKDVRYPMLKPAKPNKAHLVLAELEKKGILFLVITQNIDGLHQMAGQINVCELHGNTRQIVCLECFKKFNMEEIYPKLDVEMPPKCGCGGLLKPDVVLFGEPLPQEALNQASQAAARCDCILVVGSSLVVYPAAQIPVLAKENGAKLIIINIDPTPLDHLADLVINQNASEVLAKVTE